MPKRSADAASAVPESEAPATMSMAELTKRAKVKREIVSSTIE